MLIKKNNIKLLNYVIILPAIYIIFLSSCMHDRDNPHDPGADNNYYDGIPEISIRQGSVIIPNNGLFETDDTLLQDYIDTNFYIENTGTGYLFMENMR